MQLPALWRGSSRQPQREPGKPAAGAAPPRAADQQFHKPVNVLLMLVWVGWAVTQQRAGKRPKTRTAFACRPLWGSGLEGTLYTSLPSVHWVQQEPERGSRAELGQPRAGRAATSHRSASAAFGVCGGTSALTQPCSPPSLRSPPLGSTPGIPSS